MNAPHAQPASIVLGLGVTGLSCVRWLLARGDRVLVMDSRETPPGLGEALALREALRGAEAAGTGGAASLELITGGFSPRVLENASLVVVSPGIPLDAPVVLEAQARGLEVLGDVELFARQTAARVVAITGTNGKSTVTTLVDLMLNAAGRRSVAAGNIGRPVLDLLSASGAAPAGLGVDADAGPEVVVLELSSFQLERTASLAPDVAALLNISEDHLDHHRSFADYLAAKRRIFRGAGRAVVSADQRALLDVPADLPCTTFSCSDAGADYRLAERGGERWLARGTAALLPVRALRLVGTHNHANALASIAIVEAVLGRALPEDALAALQRFAGLPHRMQHVRTRGGVTWVDDSKATNPGAAVAALCGLETPVVLIAGGRGKGADFAPLAAALRGRARAAVLIGEDAGRMAEALRGVCPVHFAPDLPAAVTLAQQLSRTGDTVLLAPACASQDMFEDYRERGRCFARAVEELS